MKATRLLLTVLALFAIGAVPGCRRFSSRSPDVVNSIQKSIDDAGLKDVIVSQDRDKGIVTLGGRVTSESEKAQAESLAKSLAGTQVVADQIAVVPIGAGKETMAVNSDLDQGIEKNLDAALIQIHLHDRVHYAVKNGVITLSGEVNSEAKREAAQAAATGVPNVQQVVNAMQVVKHRKASSPQ